jgi:hypothetical protein
MVALASAVLTLTSAGPVWTQTTGTPPVIPDNATVLEGQPTVRVDATKEGATRHKLDRAEATRQTLKISAANGRYYWTSRDNRPLTLTTSGDFLYLSTEPGRYVRIRKINDRFAYVEHVDTEFGSVTYWGELRIVLRK